MYRYISPITIEYQPTEPNHAASVGYITSAITGYDQTIKAYTDQTFAVIDHTHDGTYVTPTDLNTSIESALASVAGTYATITALNAVSASVTSTKTEILTAVASTYATKLALASAVEDVAVTYATKQSVSDLQTTVESTYATTVTVRTMIETALTGYVNASVLSAALANYAPINHTHISNQITDATRIGGQNSLAGKVVLLSDGGKIDGAMVPVDNVSISLTNGAIGVDDNWLSDEVHDKTKTELETIAGTTLAITKSGQYFSKVISAETTISLNTSGLSPDANEIIEFDLLLNIADDVTVHLPGWLTEDGPIYNYAEAGKTLWHVWSYDGGSTWNASKESWLPPDNWKWVTTLSDAVGHEGTSLRDAIGAANNGDVIKFIPELEGTITLEQGVISPTKILTIDGGGKITIDANRTGRILEFIGATAGSVLKGFTLTKGAGSSFSAYGGGALMTRRTLDIIDCKFIDNHAVVDGENFCHGGAVYFAGPSSDVPCNVINCTFANNTVTGGSRSCYGAGLYASFAGIFNVIGCTFEGNEAIKGTANTMGGGLCAQGYGLQINLSDCKFKSNKASNGAGICLPTGVQATVTGCVFESNIAENSGAAIRTDFSTAVESCKFLNNTSASISATMYATGTSALHPDFSMVGCEVDGDTVYTNQDLYFWLCGSVDITDCVFNKVTGKSGILTIAGDYAEGNYRIARCKFENCSCPAPGVPLTWVRCSNNIELNVTDCIFRNNTGHGGGGSCMFTTTSGGNIVGSNITFINNENATVAYVPSGSLALYNSVDVGNMKSLDAATGATFTVDYLLTEHTYTGESFTNIISYDSEQPLFAEDGYTPVEGSQVIDAGDSSLTSSETDFNGDPRIVGDAVDLGAVEYQEAVNVNRLNVTNINRNLVNNRMNLVTPDIEDPDVVPEPEPLDETEHEEWLRQQEETR